MNDVVNRVLPGWVAIRIKVSKGIIGTAEYGEPDLGDLVVCFRGCLSTAKGALFIRTADVELVVVLREWLKFGCLDLIQSGLESIGLNIS